MRDLPFIGWEQVRRAVQGLPFGSKKGREYVRAAATSRQGTITWLMAPYQISLAWCSSRLGILPVHLCEVAVD